MSILIMALLSIILAGAGDFGSRGPLKGVWGSFRETEGRFKVSMILQIVEPPALLGQGA